MRDYIAVRPVAPHWLSNNYDCILAALGYEERSRFVAQQLQNPPANRIALAFKDQQCLSFDRNRAFFNQHKYSIFELSDEEFAEKIRDIVTTVCDQRHTSTFLVDISSQSRIRIARLLEVFTEIGRSHDIHVDFAYTLAAFTPPLEYEPSNSHVGPVSSAFAGWWEEPERPSTAIVGLGYEEDKALGAVEHLQAGEVWIFIPVSEVSEYSLALRNANAALLSSVKADHQLSYRVQEPFDCFVRIESLVYGVSKTYNPILLPFGPKIFALCCLLVGCLHPSVAVWRVSAEASETPIDRKASGHAYGLSVRFSPQQESESERS